MTYLVSYFAIGIALVIGGRITDQFKDCRSDEAAGWAMVVTFAWGPFACLLLLGGFFGVIGWALTGRWDGWR